MNLLRHRKRKITFKKIYISKGLGEWEEISDYTLIKYINAVSKEKKIEVAGANIKDCFDRSEITLRCTKEQMNEFVYDFLELCGNKIEEVNF